MKRHPSGVAGLIAIATAVLCVLVIVFGFGNWMPAVLMAGMLLGTVVLWAGRP